MHHVSAETQNWFEEHLARAQADSREDFEDIVRPYRIVLRRFAHKRKERRLQAKFSESDVVQITILKAFEDLHGFRGSTFEEFGNWLLGIMDHTLSGQSRRYHRPSRDVAKEVPLEEIKDSLAIRPAIEEEGQPSGLLTAALERLPELYRQVIRWKYYENCSFEEIGHRIGRTANAASHLCYRARQKLAAELREQAPAWRRDRWRSCHF